MDSLQIVGRRAARRIGWADEQADMLTLEMIRLVKCEAQKLDQQTPRQDSDEISLMLNCLNFDAPRSQWRWMTSSELYEILFDGHCPSRAEATKLGIMLRQKNLQQRGSNGKRLSLIPPLK